MIPCTALEVVIQIFIFKNVTVSCMSEKILIVDDEKGVVDMLKSYFEMQSFQVYTAYNGRDALKQAEHNPDLVLLDINIL